MHRYATVKRNGDGWAQAYRYPRRTPGRVRFTTPQPRWRSDSECLRTGLECPEPVDAHAIVTADSRVSPNVREYPRSSSFSRPLRALSHKYET